MSGTLFQSEGSSKCTQSKARVTEKEVVNLEEKFLLICDMPKIRQDDMGFF